MLYTIWFCFGEDKISPHFFFKINDVNIFLLEYLFINLHIERNKRYFTTLKTTKMTLSQFNQIATQELSKLSTNDLLETAKKLSTDYSTAANKVFNVIIDILMVRLPENEFVNFCDSL